MPSINPNGFVLWEGLSLFDDKPIAIIITGLTLSSSNRKTGNLLQSWIIRQDGSASWIVKHKNDGSICGNCPLKGDVCYVNLLPVNNIWRNYIEDRYLRFEELPRHLLNRLRKRLLRIGSYGDPCAAPIEAWLPLIELCKGHTGYTHAWMYTDPRWKDYLMASVETISLMHKAQGRGWRTFRIINDIEDLDDNELLCTNYKDNSILCEDCMLCNGGKHQSHIADVIHGAKYKINNYRKLYTEV